MRVHHDVRWSIFQENGICWSTFSSPRSHTSPVKVASGKAYRYAALGTCTIDQCTCTIDLPLQWYDSCVAFPQIFCREPRTERWEWSWGGKGIASRPARCAISVFKLCRCCDLCKVRRGYSDSGVIPLAACLLYETKFANSSVVPQGRLALILPCGTTEEFANFVSYRRQQANGITPLSE